MQESEGSTNPREDISNRYQQVIDIQTKSIRNFDDKTWRTMRVTGIISGAALGGISLVLNGHVGGPSILDSLWVRLALSISLLSFIGTFVLGIRSYRSTQFSLPPWAEIGKRMTDAPADPKEYRGSLVESYVKAIDCNRTLLDKKRDRYRQMLAALFLGIWSFGVAVMLGIWRPTGTVSGAVFTVGTFLGLVAAWLALYTNDESSSDEEESSEDFGQEGNSTAYDR